MKKLLCLMVLAACTGCVRKIETRSFDFRVRYRVFVFPDTCKLQPDGSLICKARFDPQEVKAK